MPRYAITLQYLPGFAQAEKIQSNLQAAIEKLTVLEKQTRQVCRFHASIRFQSFTFSSQASDLASTSRILIAIVTICKDSGDWGLLNEQVLLLSKKHGQLKQATTKMVQVVMSFITEAMDAEKKLSVIETLRTVTEGKVLWMPSALRV